MTMTRLVGCLGMTFFVCGCNDSKPATEAPTVASQSAPDKPIVPPKPTTDKSEFQEMTPEAISKEYLSDQKQAIEKYRNKLVHLTGTISKIVGYAKDRTYILLGEGDSTVQCELAMVDDYTSFHLQNLKEGQSVQLLGEPSVNGLELQPDGSKLLMILYCKFSPSITKE